MGKRVCSEEDNVYNVFSEFDIDKHKQTYVNYLEVMIDEDGAIHYAVPSHQEWAIYEVCRQKNLSRDQVVAMTPPEFYFDWMTWLLEQCGCVAVWNNWYTGKPNVKQLGALRRLKMAGLFNGAVGGKTK